MTKSWFWFRHNFGRKDDENDEGDVLNNQDKSL